jgi:positive regulator of sigma E activity
MKQECGKAGKHITAENTLNLPLSPGQMVETWIPPGIVAKAVFSVFLPPALAFTGGYLLSGILFPGLGEGARVFSGFIFLLAAAFVVCLLGKRSPKTRPIIRRTLQD